MNEEEFTNTSLCKECGGECCKRNAGIVYPSDFSSLDKITTELVEMLKIGNYAIDWYEGDPRPDIDRVSRVSRVYYPRPAHTNALGLLKDPSWGGICVFLSSNGCELSFEKRPFQCRSLIPQPPNKRDSGGGCTGDTNSKKNAALEWLLYQRELEEALTFAEKGTLT